MTYSNSFSQYASLNSLSDQSSFDASSELLSDTHRIVPLTSREVMGDVQPNSTLPGLFISHGAPTLALEKSATTNALARTGQMLPKPRAIVVMSAHWVSSSLEISSNTVPDTWHDFSGFSSELYDIEYPAAGHPALAESLSTQLAKMGIANSLNPLRPLDHGVWVPLLHLYPEADIPVVQISLPQHFDAYACYQLGSLFSQLRREQILVVGSGSITHNLAALNWDATSEDALAKSFKVWLLAQLKKDIPNALDWQQFEDITGVHPTSEHLLPLFFALGSGQRVSVIHESMAHHSLGMDIYRFD